MAGDKTTTKRTAAPPASKAKGSQGGKRKYRNEDTKCSVDVGAKNRGASGGEDGLLKKGPINSSTFQKGGTSKGVVKSVSDKPLDARARACAHWMEELLSVGLKGIRKEFVIHAKDYIPQNGTKEGFMEHGTMNRYDDVICLESSRVILNRDNTPDGIDYIHASFVKISPDLVYICAQGPLEHTVEHFWVMVMQEGTKVVLQLCNLMEDGVEKCNEYYPPAEHGTEWKTYGTVQVKCLDRKQNMPGMKKVLKTNIHVRMEGQEKYHELIHIFFSGWPDHGVPDSVGTVKEIRNLIHRSHEKKPVVAHCSAGIGRTGTFAMIELVCHRLLVKNDMDFKMFNVARELRDQRMHSLQNDQQYVFAYRCIIEILIGEGALPKSPEVAKFIEDYEGLVERKRKEQKQKKLRKK